MRGFIITGGYNNTVRHHRTLPAGYPRRTTAYYLSMTGHYLAEEQVMEQAGGQRLLSTNQTMTLVSLS